MDNKYIYIKKNIKTWEREWKTERKKKYDAKKHSPSLVRAAASTLRRALSFASILPTPFHGLLAWLSNETKWEFLKCIFFLEKKKHSLNAILVNQTWVFREVRESISLSGSWWLFWVPWEPKRKKKIWMNETCLLFVPLFCCWCCSTIYCIHSTILTTWHFKRPSADIESERTFFKIVLKLSWA